VRENVGRRSEIELVPPIAHDKASVFVPQQTRAAGSGEKALAIFAPLVYQAMRVFWRAAISEEHANCVGEIILWCHC
jgi:hypothetical protein